MLIWIVSTDRTLISNDLDTQTTVIHLSSMTIATNANSSAEIVASNSCRPIVSQTETLSHRSRLSVSWMFYSRNCPCDHLTKATTWTHNFSPFNLRIQMYGQRSWKCDHLRNANCGHQRSAQSVDSTWKKRPHTSNRAKSTFLFV